MQSVGYTVDVVPNDIIEVSHCKYTGKSYSTGTVNQTVNFIGWLSIEGERGLFELLKVRRSFVYFAMNLDRC